MNFLICAASHLKAQLLNADLFKLKYSLIKTEELKLITYEEPSFQSPEFST